MPCREFPAVGPQRATSNSILRGNQAAGNRLLVEVAGPYEDDSYLNPPHSLCRGPKLTPHLDLDSLWYSLEWPDCLCSWCWGFLPLKFQELEAPVGEEAGTIPQALPGLVDYPQN